MSGLLTLKARRTHHPTIGGVRRVVGRAANPQALERCTVAEFEAGVQLYAEQCRQLCTDLGASRAEYSAEEDVMGCAAPGVCECLDANGLVIDPKKKESSGEGNEVWDPEEAGGDGSAPPTPGCTPGPGAACA